MMWVQVVLGALVGETVEGTRRVGRVLAVLAVLVALAGLAGACWLIYQAGTYGWQTEDWERLDASLFFPWPFVFALFIAFLALVVRRGTSLGLTGQLRDLVASSDMRVSFPAALQPAPLTPQEVAAGSSTFQRLAAAQGWPQRRLSGMWFFVALQFMVPISNLDRALGTRTLFGIPVTSPWYALTFFVPFCVLLALFVVYTLQLLRRPRVHITVDEQGVTWWRGTHGRKQRIGWNAVRSFSVMVHQDSLSRRTTFLVDGGDALLAWTLSPRSGPDEYGESWQLSRQIATRSGQMLRDLTPLAMSLVATNAIPDRLRAIGAPEALIAGIAAAKRRLYRGLFVIVPVVVGMIAILFVGIFGMWYPHTNQQHYFAGLVPKIHAGKQLYHNALTASDSDNEWLTLSPSVATHQMSLGVVNGAYQMSAPKGQTAVWTISPVFGDVAVETTVQLSGPVTEYSGAGLIVHSNYSGEDMAVFYINPFDGSWSLAHYIYNAVNPDKDWHTLDSGVSSAIHSGDGAENTLLALARGDVTLLYINGHFVGSYSVQDHFNDNNLDAPQMIHSGYVGVYDNDGADVARFNDFTVYAIKSPPSLDYV